MCPISALYFLLSTKLICHLPPSHFSSLWKLVKEKKSGSTSFAWITSAHRIHLPVCSSNSEEKNVVPLTFTWMKSTKNGWLVVHKGSKISLSPRVSLPYPVIRMKRPAAHLHFFCIHERLRRLKMTNFCPWRKNHVSRNSPAIHSLEWTQFLIVWADPVFLVVSFLYHVRCIIKTKFTVIFIVNEANLLHTNFQNTVLRTELNCPKDHCSTLPVDWRDLFGFCKRLTLTNLVVYIYGELGRKLVFGSSQGTPYSQLKSRFSFSEESLHVYKRTDCICSKHFLSSVYCRSVWLHFVTVANNEHVHDALLALVKL